MTELIIFGFIIILFAAAIQGATGFGFSLISVPLLMIFLSPKIAIPVVLIHTIILNAIIIFELKKKLDLKKIWPLMIAGLLGMPIGTYALVIINTEIIKVIAGGVIIIFSIALLLGYKKSVKNEKIAFLPIGILSGFLNGSTSMSGPPIVLFYSNQGLDKQSFRANLVIYFLFLNIVTAISYLIAGVFNGLVIKYSLIFLPIMIAGTLIGMVLTRRINEKTFKKVILLIVLISGLAAVASGFGLI